MRESGKGDDWEDADPREGKPLAVGDKVGPWRIVARSQDEIVLAEDDKHLRFALSLRVSAVDRTVQATTAVEFHNAAGRAYFVPVKPFHRLLVPRHMEGVLRAARESDRVGNANIGETMAEDDCGPERPSAR